MRYFYVIHFPLKTDAIIGNGYSNVRNVIMTPINSFDKMAAKIAEMTRNDVIYRIHAFEKFRLDFTDSYLNDLSIDKLQHILLAAMMTTVK